MLVERGDPSEAESLHAASKRSVEFYRSPGQRADIETPLPDGPVSSPSYLQPSLMAPWLPDFDKEQSDRELVTVAQNQTPGTLSDAAPVGLRLTPVDYDPFAGMQPVDYDPWDGRPMPSTYEESRMDAAQRRLEPVDHDPFADVSNLEAADKTLNLTPQERALYQRHLTNLSGPGGVDNPRRGSTNFRRMAPRTKPRPATSGCTTTWSVTREHSCRDVRHPKRRQPTILKCSRAE
jgi:hypothetical protein